MHDTYKFWHRFLLEDSLPYLSLYISLRYRNWDMRLASYKQMVPLFTAYDHGTYQRLIPHHLHDLFSLPECLTRQLQKGAFSVRLKALEWNGVAIDECHEMQINKDCKLAIVRPSKDRMTFLANHLPFRAASIRNLKHQVLPPKKKENPATNQQPGTRLFSGMLKPCQLPSDP